MCGEHGSAVTGNVGGVGIIPACAGSTSVPVVGTWLGGDHPRMCGEHDVGRFDAEKSEGSSPHVRGAPRNRIIFNSIIGIIPACAGSTTTPVASVKRPRDHPRMCGEHALCDYCGTDYRGSSPHVRGAPVTPERSYGSPGIIPACAGSTASCLTSTRCSRDHPRMCGEHNRLLPRGRTAKGSSPHVRGARCHEI